MFLYKWILIVWLLNMSFTSLLGEYCCGSTQNVHEMCNWRQWVYALCMDSIGLRNFLDLRSVLTQYCIQFMYIHIIVIGLICFCMNLWYFSRLHAIFSCSEYNLNFKTPHFLGFVVNRSFTHTLHVVTYGLSGFGRIGVWGNLSLVTPFLPEFVSVHMLVLSVWETSNKVVTGDAVIEPFSPSHPFFPH